MHTGLRASFVLSAVALGLALLGACGGGGGSTGDSCSSAGGCGGGVCLQSSDFPGGYCSQACNLSDPSSCPGGSVCIDDASGAPSGTKAVCYKTCKTNSDCSRPGFACLEKANQLVCRNGG